MLAVSENCGCGRLAKLLSIDVLYGIDKLVHVRTGNFRTNRRLTLGIYAR
jgi:hypothetical protein